MLRATATIPPSTLPLLSQALFIGRGLNFQSTADQALAKQFTGTKYRITDIVAVCKTGGGSVVCAGGIYDTAAKGGNAVVAAAQSWVALGAGIIVIPTLAVVTAILSGTLILSLTTGSTAAVTADVFVFGYIID